MFGIEKLTKLGLLAKLYGLALLAVLEKIVTPYSGTLSGNADVFCYTLKNQ
jgi:hypothetical protein